jgi:hypothetical protein
MVDPSILTWKARKKEPKNRWGIVENPPKMFAKKKEAQVTCSNRNTAVRDIASAGIATCSVASTAQLVRCATVTAVTLGFSAASIGELATTWETISLEAEAASPVCQTTMALVAAATGEPRQGDFHCFLDFDRLVHLLDLQTIFEIRGRTGHRFLLILAVSEVAVCNIAPLIGATVQQLLLAVICAEISNGKDLCFRATLNFAAAVLVGENKDHLVGVFAVASEPGVREVTSVILLSVCAAVVLVVPSVFTGHTRPHFSFHCVAICSCCGSHAKTSMGEPCTTWALVVSSSCNDKGCGHNGAHDAKLMKLDASIGKKLELQA